MMSKVSVRRLPILKRAGLLIMVLLLISSAVACGGGTTSESADSTNDRDNNTDSASADDPQVLKMAHSNNEEHKYHQAMVEVKKMIEERSEGRYEVEVFAGTLGSDEDLVEGLQMGSVDGAIINTAVLAALIPDLGVIDMPFMFEDREHAYRVLDGEIGDDFLRQINEKDIVALSYWENGFKGITNNERPIKTPDDLKGLKIRTMESEVQLEAFKAWGANPTPMSFSEVYQAMQQGVIDGHFNAPDTVAANKMWEVQDYYSDIPLFYGALVFGFSPQTWNQFSEEDKEMFTQIAYDSRDFERELAEKEAVAGLEELKANMDVVEDPDVEAFIQSVESVWQQYAAEFSDGLIEKVANH